MLQKAQGTQEPHKLRAETDLTPTEVKHTLHSHHHQTWLQLKQKRALQPLVIAQNCQKSNPLGCSWSKDPLELPLPQH